MSEKVALELRLKRLVRVVRCLGVREMLLQHRKQCVERLSDGNDADLIGNHLAWLKNEV